jgi:GH25 family lysozyme M1 (1,4-beta-N-acetylmuramidase)
VSQWQGKIDWSTVAINVDFVIIRAGYGKESNQIDTFFETNYSGCINNKIPCGAYWYSYAESVDDAIAESKICIDTLKNKTFEFPIFYDIEENRTLKLGKDKVSEIAAAFCNELEKAGYWVGIYSSSYNINTYLTDDVKTKYALWVAHWGVDSPNVSTYGIHQYASNGAIDGITGDVDLDKSIVDYPTLIKSVGLNNTTKTVNEKTTADITVTVNGEKYSGKISKE